MFFVVWGWAILVATAVGLLAGILAAVAVGLVGSEIDPAVGTELPADFTDGLVGAGVAFALLFGVLGGFGFGIGSGLFAAAAAALTHTRLPPAGTGLVAALVGTGMTFLGTVAPVAAGGQGAEGFVVVAAIPLAVMFVGLFLVTWLTARRSARAARGA
ncbi:hypothetical protein [Euzebya sp.]|uniref:hypothetical protein n=1 Tax=Euzebya sp. TaxID=1971409 RepID=UPI003517E361